MNKKHIKIILSVVVTVVMLYLIYSRMNFHNFLNTVKVMNFYYFVLALVITFLGFYVVAWRWQLLLKNAGLKAKLHDLTVITFVFYFFNTFLPGKLAEVYRSYLIKKNYGFSGSKTFGTIFVERLFDVIFLALMFILFAYFSFKEFTGYIYIFYIPIIVLVLFFYLVARFGDKISNILPKKIAELFCDFTLGMKTSVTFKDLPMLILMSLVRWIVVIVPVYLVFLAFDLYLPFLTIVFIVVAMGLVSAIPITPAGAGLAELTIIGILVYFGITNDLAIAVSLIIRFVSYWSVMIFGGVVYLVLLRGDKYVVH